MIALFSTVALFVALKDFAYTLLSRKTPWMIFVIVFSVINTGGYMWNTIRNPPFIAAGDGGRADFIAGGFQNQYGVETFIVASLCNFRHGNH